MASSLPCCLLLLLSALLAASDADAARLGGLTPISDAATNNEMQDLGSFSVDEYNDHRQDESSPPLTFSSVTSASKLKVASGVKYYLEVAGTVTHVNRVFDAVVLVDTDEFRELISFKPVDDRIINN